MRRSRAALATLFVLAALVLVTGCFLLPNRAPTAAFVVNYRVTPDPLIVELDASTSSDPDGDAIASYLWTFGEVGADVLTPLVAYSGVAHVPVILVRFPEEGIHEVELLVIDERGAASETTFSIDVIVPNITVEPMP